MSIVELFHKKWFDMAAHTKRNSNGTLKKGHAGLKRKGCTNRYTKFKEMAQSKESEILERLFELALQGNPTALSFVAVKMFGSAPLPNSIGLDGASTANQIRNLNKRIKAGELSAQDAVPLLDLVKAKQVSVEIEELKKTMKEIEDYKK